MEKKKYKALYRRTSNRKIARKDERDCQGSLFRLISLAREEGGLKFWSVNRQFRGGEKNLDDVTVS